MDLKESDFDHIEYVTPYLSSAFVKRISNPMSTYFL